MNTTARPTERETRSFRNGRCHSRDWQRDRGIVVSPGWFRIGRARHVVRGEVRSFDPYPGRNEPSLRIKVPSIQHQGPIMLLPEWAQAGAEALHQMHDSCHGDIPRFTAASDLLQPSDSDDPSGTITKIRRFLIEHSPDAPAELADVDSVCVSSAPA